MTVRTENGATYAQTWDYENRLSSVTANGQTTTFTYDGNGALVKKATNSNPPDMTVYVGNVYEAKPLQTGSSTKYYYFNGSRIAMKLNGVLYYLMGDHLGSTSIVLPWRAGREGGRHAEPALRPGALAQRHVTNRLSLDGAAAVGGAGVVSDGGAVV